MRAAMQALLLIRIRPISRELLKTCFSSQISVSLTLLLSLHYSPWRRLMVTARNSKFVVVLKVNFPNSKLLRLRTIFKSYTINVARSFDGLAKQAGSICIMLDTFNRSLMAWRFEWEEEIVESHNKHFTNRLAYQGFTIYVNKFILQFPKYWNRSLHQGQAQNFINF